MVAILTTPPKTVSDYLALSEDTPRCELVRGKYYMLPAPNENHQYAVNRLTVSIFNYLDEHPEGAAIASPLDVFLEEISAVQPDLVYVAFGNERARLEGGLWGVPDLVVEILSPSNAAHDLVTKRSLYREHLVREIWMVDPKAKTIRIDRIDSESGAYLPEILLSESDTLTTPVLPGYQLAISRLFTPPWTRGRQGLSDRPQA